ncbi:unnamed protein product [Paramecium octaurelia]|uniref:Uncharacterized protein n=1 Tax=Paramecium octaurelia TaxID=43137 RepID=A0A8S1UGY1_PAROT|nr:unnamed protein product [Paramecium octaurelia]
MSYHYLFKFIIIGDTAVGKSCILYQFLEQKFRVKHEMTVGVEFGAKFLDLDGKQIKLQIWDTAGQETFKSITRQYYRSAAGAILVYDVTRRESFENVREWIKECQVHGTQDMVIVLVGNKVDLEKQYNIHNINGVKFPNLKGSNQRMKKIYCLLKQVRRIIQTLLKHSPKQHLKYSKSYRKANRRVNYQESELDKQLTKHNFNNRVPLQMDVAEIIINYKSLLHRNYKIQNLMSNSIILATFFQDLIIIECTDHDEISNRVFVTLNQQIKIAKYFIRTYSNKQTKQHQNRNQQFQSNSYKQLSNRYIQQLIIQKRQKEFESLKIIDIYIIYIQ